MTETRPTDEINADVALWHRFGAWSTASTSSVVRLLYDVEPLLAERDAAVARAEQAEADLRRLRTLSLAVIAANDAYDDAAKIARAALDEPSKPEADR